MSVNANHVGASIRFLDQQDQAIKTLHRVRPNLERADITAISEGISMITGVQPNAILMTVTSELVRQ